MPSRMVHVLRAWMLRFNSRRSRRILIACVATCGITGGLLGTVAFVRWRADRAVRGDTRVVLTQAGQQLTRALQSRRGTLTLLRDTLDKAPDLNAVEQQALAKSAVGHTRHLLGVGLIRRGPTLTWWVPPLPATSRAFSQLNRTLTQRTRSRSVWRATETFTVLTQSDRNLLIMFEPLRMPANEFSALVGVFDLNALLTDFFELTLQQPYPVQLLETDHLLYRSSRWQASLDGRRSTIIEYPFSLHAVRWVLQMQPGSTQVMQTISSVRGFLVGVSVLAGLAIIGLVWLLAMRTWILQRAVSRRTAALRRTTQRLRQLAITDELTGLSNRRFFLERWQWEYERAKRYQRPLACLMIDVNEFKRINDQLGHSMGDLVIKQVAQELKTQLRQSDVLARFGGDEFIIALPETSFAQAAAVAGKLRELLLNGPWSHGVGPVRLSVGVSHLQADESAQQVIQNADKALYASRRVSPRRTAHDAIESPASAPW